MAFDEACKSFTEEKWLEDVKQPWGIGVQEEKSLLVMSMGETSNDDKNFEISTFVTKDEPGFREDGVAHISVSFECETTVKNDRGNGAGLRKNHAKPKMKKGTSKALPGIEGKTHAKIKTKEATLEGQRNTEGPVGRPRRRTTVCPYCLCTVADGLTADGRPKEHHLVSKHNAEPLEARKLLANMNSHKLKKDSTLCKFCSQVVKKCLLRFHEIKKHNVVRSKARGPIQTGNGFLPNADCETAIVKVPKGTKKKPIDWSQAVLTCQQRTVSRPRLDRSAGKGWIRPTAIQSTGLDLTHLTSNKSAGEDKARLTSDWSTGQGWAGQTTDRSMGPDLTYPTGKRSPSEGNARLTSDQWTGPDLTELVCYHLAHAYTARITSDVLNVP